MKKKLHAVLCPLLAAGICLSVAACGGGTDSSSSAPEEDYPELDLAHAFTDDFNSVDRSYWSIMNTRWGGESHGGVIRENVGYTEDGYLVLTANGDYYNGEKKDVLGRVGRRTGGAIVSHKALGPGEFSVRMKALPRFGATTAFWTYFNDGHTLNDRGKVYNSEIDFELNVDSFDITMCTNWTAVEPGNYDNRKIQMDFYHNDGNWHEYTFKWMTNPERVDYFVDGVKISSSTANVPIYAAQVNIGVWFASFAGTPDFETDYCLVDWFKYVPYKDQPYVETPDGTIPPTDDGYPSAPITLPEHTNLIGDAGFEYPYDAETSTLNAWYLYPGDDEGKRTLADLKLAGEGRNGSTGMVLRSHDRITQTFSQVWPGYEAELSLYVKHSAAQSGTLTIQYLMSTENVIGSDEISINADTPGFKDGEFYQITKHIVVPETVNGQEVKRIRLRFAADEKDGNQIVLDDLFMYHVVS